MYDCFMIDDFVIYVISPFTALVAVLMALTGRNRFLWQLDLLVSMANVSFTTSLSLPHHPCVLTFS